MVNISAEDLESRDEPATEHGNGNKSNPMGTATVTIDDQHLTAGYANFCRVSSTPEEMILDFGLNPNPYGTGNTTVRVAQRIIVNHFTAKRLLIALSRALQRHEQAFGVLETDVRKRVREG